MKTKGSLTISGLILLLIVILAGCSGSSGSSPADRSGQWLAYTGLGQFTLKVNATGEGIILLDYSYECRTEEGSFSRISLKEPIQFQKPIRILENSFKLKVGDDMKLEGTFSSDNNTLSGTWSFLTCKEEYKVRRNGEPDFETVKIGDQVWMKSNLNQWAPGSWCYENDPEACSKYGRLYKLETAQKICPTGWHIPTKEEWQILFDNLGGMESAGEKLKLGGSSGFDALAGGVAMFVCKGIGQKGSFFTSTDYDDSGKTWIVRFREKTSTVEFGYSTKNVGMSVRYIKD